jgi:hypothetical protein
MLRRGCHEVHAVSNDNTQGFVMLRVCHCGDLHLLHVPTAGDSLTSLPSQGEGEGSVASRRSRRVEPLYISAPLPASPPLAMHHLAGAAAAFVAIATVAVQDASAFAGAPALRSRIATTATSGRMVSSLRMVSGKEGLEGATGRREFFREGAALAVASGLTAAAGVGAPGAALAAEKVNAWEQVQLPTATTLYDIDFDTKDPKHGFIVGAKGTFLEVSERMTAHAPRVSSSR